jgi:hypothetical protein
MPPITSCTCNPSSIYPYIASGSDPDVDQDCCPEEIESTVVVEERPQAGPSLASLNRSILYILGLSNFSPAAPRYAAAALLVGFGCGGNPVAPPVDAGPDAALDADVEATDADVESDADVEGDVDGTDAMCNRVYNETTEEINQATDGVVSRIRLLEEEPAEGILTPQLRDFVNETQALSSEDMPVDTGITSLDPSCFVQGTRYMYAITEDTATENRGIYTSLPISLFETRQDADGDGESECVINGASTLFHEIGHFQPGGDLNDEVTSELNSFEDGLMAFVAFLNQGAETSDVVRWASHVNMPSRNLTWYSLTEAIWIVNSGFTDLGFDKYNRADIFILNRLLASGGNFRTVRDEIGGGYYPFHEIEQSVEEFTEYYSPDNYGGDSPKEDTSLSLRIIFFQELYRRFGEETAMAFFEANSHASHLDGALVDFSSLLRRVERIYTYPPEGMNCVNVSWPLLRQPGGACEESDERCNFLEGLIVSDFAESVPYCCINVEINDDGTIEARKWLMRADYRIFYDAEGNYLWLRDNPWEAIEYIDPVETLEIGINERCASL